MEAELPWQYMISVPRGKTTARTTKSAQPPTRAATIPWPLDGSWSRGERKKSIYHIGRITSNTIRHIIIELIIFGIFFLQINIKPDLGQSWPRTWSWRFVVITRCYNNKYVQECQQLGKQNKIKQNKKTPWVNQIQAVALLHGSRPRMAHQKTASYSVQPEFLQQRPAKKETQKDVKERHGQMGFPEYRLDRLHDRT